MKNLVLRVVFNVYFGVGCLISCHSLFAQQPFLADGGLVPGGLWRADGSAVETLVHRRPDRTDPAFPGGINKLAQVAVGPDGKVYFCSGLDGYVMTLLEGRHEVSAFSEVQGQIRDIACSGEEHTVYYSVVPTPQNSQPLADGFIYRRDVWEGRATLVATIRQSAVGGNWWGTFAIRDGSIYLATTEPDSRILKWDRGAISPVAVVRGHRIEGLAVAPDTSFHFVTGTNKVFTTADFASFTSSEATLNHITDVAFPTSASSARP